MKQSMLKGIKALVVCCALAGVIGVTGLGSRPAQAALIFSQNYGNQAFAVNSGPTFSSSLFPNTGNYSIVTDFSFTDLTGFRKIIDFKDQTSDNGLYNLNSALNFFPVVTGAPVFSPNQLSRVVITRDDTSNLFNGYVNGISQFAFADNGDLGVFASNINFFRDDSVVSGEASAGNLDYIGLYDNVLSAGDVALLGGPGNDPTTAPVPEPGTMTLMALGLTSLVGAARRRKKMADNLTV